MDEHAGVEDRVVRAVAYRAAMIAGTTFVIGMNGKRGRGLNGNKARQNGEDQKGNVNFPPRSLAVRVLT